MFLKMKNLKMVKFNMPASSQLFFGSFFFQTYFFTDQEDAEVNESLGRCCLKNLLNPN